MDIFRIILADDDEPSRILLRYFIQMLPSFKIIGEAADGKELIQLVLSEKPDIVLVDINMPGLNGMEAVKTCKGLLPDLHVIFTTGYDEYAVEAFNVAAVDYITKPIESSRLFIALEKAKRSIETNHVGKAPFIQPKGHKKLSIKSNHTYLYLNMEDILFIEKEGRKTVIHTQKESFETNELLNDLEDKLEAYFYKTHRSFLVNLKQVLKIEPRGESYIAFFSNSDKTVHISRLKINEVQELMNQLIET